MSSLMTIKPWGGVNEYGRNCFYIECGKKRILLDCGINKGTFKIPDMNKEKVQLLDYVFLSHGHIDHYGALHELYSMGYKNKVYMTRDTKKQIYDYLQNHKDIQTGIMEEICEPLAWHKFDEEMSILWGRNGHVQGAIWMAVKFKEDILFYSGDFTKDILMLPQDDPVKILKGCSIENGIIDCGSGDLQEHYSEILENVKEQVKKTLFKKGNILFLSHIHGKGTELFLVLLREFKDRKFVVTKDFFKGVKELVKISPAIDIEELNDMEENIEIIDESVDVNHIQRDSKIYFCENVTDKIQLESKIMKKVSEYKENSIIFTSKQPPNSVGLYMLNNVEKFNSEIKYINIKAHQSKKEAVEMAGDMGIRKCIYFHLKNDDR